MAITMLIGSCDSSCAHAQCKTGKNIQNDCRAALRCN